SAPLFAHAEARRTRRFSREGEGEGEGGGEEVAAGPLALRRLRGVFRAPVMWWFAPGGGARVVKLASPGALPDGMSRDPTGRNHIQHERGSGRGTLGSTTNAARRLRALRGSVGDETPRLRVT